MLALPKWQSHWSDGTFPSYEQVEQAWVDVAGLIRRGVRLDPVKGRTVFAEFAAIYLAPPRTPRPTPSTATAAPLTGSWSRRSGTCA